MQVLRCRHSCGGLAATGRTRFEHDRPWLSEGQLRSRDHIDRILALLHLVLILEIAAALPKLLKTERISLRGSMNMAAILSMCGSSLRNITHGSEHVFLKEAPHRRKTMTSRLLSEDAVQQLQDTIRRFPLCHLNADNCCADRSAV